MLNLLQQVVSDTLKTADTLGAPVYTAPAAAPVVAQPAHVGFGQSLVDSFRGAMTMILAAIPKIIGFLLILFIGWLIAGWVAGLITRLLRAIRFNDAADKAGLGKFVASTDPGTDPSAAAGGVVKWIIRLVVMLAAVGGLGLPAM